MSKLDAVPQLNAVEWAPAGGWLAVLARMSTGGNIVFIDASGQEAKRTSMAEHPGFDKVRVGTGREAFQPTSVHFASTQNKLSFITGPVGPDGPLLRVVLHGTGTRRRRHGIQAVHLPGG